MQRLSASAMNEGPGAARGKPRATGLLMSLSTAALVCGLATPALAIHREDDLYERKRVTPGEFITRTVTCATGEMTGGGYQISGAPEDVIAFNVTANYPLSDGRWRVALRNVTDENQELTLRIYVLCTDE